ncbi:hypothetical protein ACFX13_034735 [Malus domestica]
MLSNATILTIKEALYSPRFGRTLVSFRDIRDNQYHLETTEDHGSKFLCITSYKYGQKHIHEKLERLPSGLYITTIRGIEAHNVAGLMPEFQDTLLLWHDRLGHPGCDMMRHILKSSHRHKLYPYVGVPPRKACSLGKLNTQPSHTKIIHDPPKFLQRIQGDICGLIQPTCRPFRYFMVLVDASTRWTHVCLLSTCNATFTKLLAQIIKIRVHHLDYPIKSIRLDNAEEFTSQTFDDYCMLVGIDVEHHVPHVHTQNGLAEAFIKLIQLIAQPLVMRTKLLVSAWGYAILHAAMLVYLRPTATQPHSPL